MTGDQVPQPTKAELLSKLKIIDSEDEPQSGISMKLVVPIIAAGLVVIVVLFMAMGRSSDSPAPAQVEEQVNTVKAPADVSQRRIVSNPEILNASGYVTARVRATVSAEIMGRINSVLVEEGMRVEKGQVLAEIDSTVARVDWQLAQARAVATSQRLAGAKAEYGEARRVLNRLRSLDKNQFTSESAITRAEANVASLNAQIKALEADLSVSDLSAKRQKELLDKHTLRAPFSGIVTVKNAQPGEIISPSSAGGGFTRTGICTVVDMNSLEIEVDVNESYIGRVFQNQKVTAKLDAYPKWEIPAKVIAVIPTADRAKATVRVRIGLLENNSKILPEMGVKVAFFEEAIKEDDINE